MSDERDYDEVGFDPAEIGDVPDEPIDGSGSTVEPSTPKISVAVTAPVTDDEPAEDGPGAEEAVEYEYVYVDEHGNELPAPGDDVPSAPVVGDGPATTPVMSGRSKAVLAGVGVAVVAVVGVVAVGLSQIGGQNTLDDAKAAGQSKYAQASEKVAAKSGEVRGEVAETAIDACRTGKLAGPGGLGDAMADGTEQPKLKLDVVASTPLPGAFIQARTNADGVQGNPSLLQLTKTGWGVYTTVPLTRAEKKNRVDRPGFHKADVTVTDDAVRVTGDRAWAGGDVGGAGSCEPGSPGVYAATGQVPADAAGLVDGRASVDAIQGVAGEADKAVAIMGNSIALVKLVENTSEGGDASSSVVPSK
ncbi:hypothetical protein GYA93_12575 [Gordonia desulfuricans]|uniref:Uncharacterized protein n=1 Tax=Gordonia desulfuricans TaxID=89051 RepID=A0A7K3LQF2_9ACTN|nr:hypothetical protein [Gordonia desulfuricans]NDK90406.1 hypothetical protein [Gordonia desulfuricans]